LHGGVFVKWASGPFFIYSRYMGSASDSLKASIAAAVESLGYEFVGLEYRGSGDSGSLLRVYIDHADGVDLDDCAAVSHQVSGVLDVEDPIGGHYTLEVSSPGLDRPLFSKQHFERFAGSRVSIKLRQKLQDRRRFEGVLQGVREDDVVVEVDGSEFRLPLDQIEKARLVPEF
jgi:ribosome maturation factor RimP